MRYLPLLLLPLLAVAPVPAPATAPALPPSVPLTWSSRITDTTPVGNLHFHGPFSQDTLTVSADKLPAHDFLDISVDLLILRSWDGSANWGFPHQEQDGGPDGFRLALVDGPTLLYTTFSNTPIDRNFYRVAQVQAFPSQVPGDKLPTQTGAVAKNSLGYNNPWPGKPALFPMDSTYHLHYVIPHTAARIALDFSAVNLQNLIDESWGVADVRIVPVAAAQVQKPSADAIAKAFTNSLDPISTTQLEDFQTLISGMDDTTAWIDSNITPAPIDAASALDCIKTLGATDAHIGDREAAQPVLLQMGPQIEPMLRDARHAAGTEHRLRIDWVLLSSEVTPINDDNLRKVLLATRALEIINTPKSLALRKKLTQD